MDVLTAIITLIAGSIIRINIAAQYHKSI